MTGQSMSAPPPLRPLERVPPGRFQLPVDRFRERYDPDKYFARARHLNPGRSGRNPRVAVQVFQKQPAWLGGVDEAIAILKTCLTEGYDWSDLEVFALRDGDKLSPHETVMADYRAISRLRAPGDSLPGCDGPSHASRDQYATRRRSCMAQTGDVLSLARFDHWRVQTGDGYAAHIAGAIGVSTDAQASWWGSAGVGTIPHALIAAFGGDTVEATRAFAAHTPADVPVVSLVDFNNDCVSTSLAVARALGSRLGGVRLDTSESLVD